MDKKAFMWLFFGLSGRISRSVYFLGNIFAGLFPLFAFYRLSLLPEGADTESGWALFFLVSAVIAIWSQLALGVKRFHDFGRPGIFAASLFIPVISILVFVALCLYPGDEDTNEYGKVTNEPQ
ncbi:DUF805 domain-containing protein [Chelativorans sp. YIM 93263]|uniref:DUF805 domain-containing protein n=1 Tax=Chelativorans sp. YIM 93263 TaxID=2906648 RepID=UPI0023798A43|nr:DUF805 domain-containing protein [Chelativorans sp. YIM 93263]